MHDPASELPRIPIPRTSVHKGKKKAGALAAPALALRVVLPSFERRSSTEARLGCHRAISTALYVLSANVTEQRWAQGC
jgi:hypothetical protein